MKRPCILLLVFLLASSVFLPALAAEKMRLAKFEGWVVSEPCAKENRKAENMDWVAACDPETVPWILWVDKSTRHEFANPETLEDVFGKKVRLIGSLDENGMLRTGTAKEIE